MTSIEWTDETWNPIVGCSVVSPGCTNCYAMRLAGRRLKHTEKYRGLTINTKAGPAWTGTLRLWEPALTAPLHWKKPRKIFVNSQGDLFHESIPDEWIDRVFAVMALAPQHTFQVLTKRAERMRQYLGWQTFDRIYRAMMVHTNTGWPTRRETCAAYGIPYRQPRSAEDWWPLRNVWLGVSCERQQEADERIPLLLQTPAAIRFVSAEPLLEPIDLQNLRGGTLDALRGHDFEDIGDIRDPGDLSKSHHPPALDWVIAGGESGPNARPMHPDWARTLRDQCADAGVPFFFKQWGEHGPSDLRGFGNPTHRCGKKAAGRLLDGVDHNEFPQLAAQATAA